MRESNHEFKLDDGTQIKRGSSNGDSDEYSLNSSDDSNYNGVYDGHLPIIGFVKSTSGCVMSVYSLKNETVIHIWRFASEILKF